MPDLPTKPAPYGCALALGVLIAVLFVLTVLAVLNALGVLWQIRL